VEYAEWAPYYARIQREFGFSWPKERAAADRLLRLLPPNARIDPLARIGRRLAGRDAVIVGLGPRAGAPPVWRLPPATPPPSIVAADGAAARCLAADLVPDVIVTDLDGPVPSEISANARGSLVLIHAHGDNVPALEEWVPQFGHELAGSWAGPPTTELVNVGGFTDGDRAAFLAHHAGARRLLLWGFNFEETDERDPEIAARKLAKLRWTATLLGLLARPPTSLLVWRSDGTLVPYAGLGTGPSTQ